ncbi:hypothetical protein K438DRAFT_2153271, partial [Mycena galopus ATCC 62051]
FETLGEPVDGRAKVEELLALLADISHVGLVITMRGAERPGKVQWTHPFLRPLLPLARVAARQTFIDIADEVHEDSEVDQLLNITDNIPLAVQLIATVVASDGCQATLRHWEQDRTAMLSDGSDKRSNLEISISLSLSSPRMLLVPQAADLLSLVSLLSDGISDMDLAHSKPPIQDLPRCKETLIRTSLAYVGGSGEFKVLAPICEYIKRVRPPSPLLVRPLRDHFSSLLKLLPARMDLAGVAERRLTPRLVSNFGNLHNLLEHGLNSDPAYLRQTMECIILFSHLNCWVNCGRTPLLLPLGKKLDKVNDPKLSGEFIIRVFQMWEFSPLINPENSLRVGLEHFRVINDMEGEAQLYYMAASYYLNSIQDYDMAQNFYECGLSLATQCKSDDARTLGLIGLATMASIHGNYAEGLNLAAEAHRISVARGYFTGELDSMRWQAYCYNGLGKFNHGLELVQKAKVIIACARIQGSQIENWWMNIEGCIYTWKTEYVKEQAIQEILLRQTSPVLSPLQHALALLNIAILNVLTGASAEIVTRNLDAAASIYQSVGKLDGMSRCALTRADLQLCEGHRVVARAEYIRLLAESEGKDLGCLHNCLHHLASSLNPVHNATEIARWAVVFVAFTLLPSARDVVLLHFALQCFGDALAEQGINDTAINILTVALEGFTWMDVHSSRAQCMQSIGDLHMRRGEFSKASTFWKEARPLFEVSSQAKSVVGIDSRLAELEKHHQANIDQFSNLNVPDLPVGELSIVTEASHQAEASSEGAPGGRHIEETLKVLSMV